MCIRDRVCYAAPRILKGGNQTSIVSRSLAIDNRATVAKTAAGRRSENKRPKFGFVRHPLLDRFPPTSRRPSAKPSKEDKTEASVRHGLSKGQSDTGKDQ